MALESELSFLGSLTPFQLFNIRDDILYLKICRFHFLLNTLFCLLKHDLLFLYRSKRNLYLDFYRLFWRFQVDWNLLLRIALIAIVRLAHFQVCNLNTLFEFLILRSFLNRIHRDHDLLWDLVRSGQLDGVSFETKVLNMHRLPFIRNIDILQKLIRLNLGRRSPLVFRFWLTFWVDWRPRSLLLNLGQQLIELLSLPFWKSGNSPLLMDRLFDESLHAGHILLRIHVVKSRLKSGVEDALIRAFGDLDNEGIVDEEWMNLAFFYFRNGNWTWVFGVKVDVLNVFTHLKLTILIECLFKINKHLKTISHPVMVINLLIMKYSFYQLLLRIL